MPFLEQNTPALTGLPVRDVMSRSLLTCRPDTPVRDVARLMATLSVHAVPIENGSRVRRIVTARELVQVACSTAEHTSLTAEDVAVDAVTVGPDDLLPTAAARMLEGKASHLVVVDPPSGDAIGVVSDADIVRRWSWPD
jgi:CBS domain-containing protein